jgi:hypothetical protein
LNSEIFIFKHKPLLFISIALSTILSREKKKKKQVLTNGVVNFKPIFGGPVNVHLAIFLRNSPTILTSYKKLGGNNKAELKNGGEDNQREEDFA